MDCQVPRKKIIRVIPFFHLCSLLVPLSLQLMKEYLQGQFAKFTAKTQGEKWKSLSKMFLSAIGLISVSAQYFTNSYTDDFYKDIRVFTISTMTLLQKHIINVEEWTGLQNTIFIMTSNTKRWVVANIRGQNKAGIEFMPMPMLSLRAVVVEDG